MIANSDSPASTGKLSRNAMAHVLMFAMVMLWGSMFVVVKEALARIEPQWFNALRMMLAFSCIAVVYRRQWRQLTRTAWLAGAVAGACMAAGFFFQTEGLLYTTATNSAFLTAMVVVLVPFLGIVPGLRAAGGGLPRWTAWAGAALALLGVALLTTPAHTPWLRLLQTFNRGDLLSLACAVGFSLQIVALDHGARRVSFQQLSLLQIGFAAVFLTAAALLAEPPGPHALARIFSSGSPLRNADVLLAIAIAGILATAVAFSIQVWAQQVIPPTNLAVLMTLEPVFAGLTAFLVLGERLGRRSGLGVVFVLAGILTAEILPRWLPDR